ncbi:MAG: transposase [Chitinophagales bacterium]|nr:transposase [Chitinophagales bacterium]
MTTRTTYSQSHHVYFITFTCLQWLPLFEITALYDYIYDWFARLRKDSNQLIGYVIMPNHIHLLLFIPDRSKPVNDIIKEGKRFMAYEIVKWLKQLNRKDILMKLSSALTDKGKEKRKVS